MTQFHILYMILCVIEGTQGAARVVKVLSKKGRKEK